MRIVCPAHANLRVGHIDLLSHDAGMTDRTGFHAWPDDHAAVAEAASQVLLGAVFVGVGLASFAVPGLSPLGTFSWVAGWSLVGAWTGVRGGVAVWRGIYRIRSLRGAVAGTGRVLASRPTGQLVDEWGYRRYVDIDLAVVLPTGPERTVRVRHALSAEQEAQLEYGVVVAVRAHPVRPVVEIDLGSLEPRCGE